MVNVNVLYNQTTGRILAAGLNAVSPVPSGFGIVVKDIAPMTGIFDKRINPDTLALVDKDYIKIDSATTVPIATVQTLVFTKRNGETNEMEDDPANSEAVLVSARRSDQAFVESERRAFFNILQTAFALGAAQVKVATGLAPGKETIVLFNDTLSPVFKVVDYV